MDDDEREYAVLSILDDLEQGQEVFYALWVRLLAWKIKSLSQQISEIAPALTRKSLELMDARAEIERLNQKIWRLTDQLGGK